MATVQVGISAEVAEAVDAYAKEKNITKGEAATRLITTAVGRISAVRKYAEEHRAAPKAKKAKAKAAPAKKAAKAKGPIARKARKTAKAETVEQQAAATA